MSDDEKADALWGCNDAKLKQVASDSPAIPETWRCPNCHVRFSRIDDVDAHLASLPTPASHTAPDAQTVERMARAIHLYDATTGGDPTWEELGENGQEDCRDRAVRISQRSPPPPPLAMKWSGTMIDVSHRYLIKRNVDGDYVGSTDDLGKYLQPAHCLVDTIGEDGLGTKDGRRGIPDFLNKDTGDE